MPTLPVHQYASTVSSPSGVVYPLARPHSQSITAFGASASFAPPQVGQPWERPVPGDEECTTANPRGTHVPTSEREIMLRVRYGIGGIAARAGGVPPTSCFGS